MSIFKPGRLIEPQPNVFNHQIVDATTVFPDRNCRRRACSASGAAIRGDCVMTCSELAKLLGGDVCSDEVLCPGPGHSNADRSLSVKPDSDAADGFLVYSFAGDDPILCRDHVRTKLGLPPFGRRRRMARRVPAPRGRCWLSTFIAMNTGRRIFSSRNAATAPARSSARNTTGTAHGGSKASRRAPGFLIGCLNYSPHRGRP